MEVTIMEVSNLFKELPFSNQANEEEVTIILQEILSNVLSADEDITISKSDYEKTKATIKNLNETNTKQLEKIEEMKEKFRVQVKELRITEAVVISKDLQIINLRNKIAEIENTKVPFLNHSIEKEEILSNMLSADKDIIISKSDDENTKATIKNLNETNTKQLEKIDEPFSTQSIEDEEILSNMLSADKDITISKSDYEKTKATIKNLNETNTKQLEKIEEMKEKFRVQVKELRITEAVVISKDLQIINLRNKIAEIENTKVPFLNHSIEKEEILSNMLSADKDIIISKSDDENTKATIKNLNETNTKQLEKIDEPFSTQSIEDEEILSNMLSADKDITISKSDYEKTKATIKNLNETNTKQLEKIEEMKEKFRVQVKELRITEAVVISKDLQIINLRNKIAEIENTKVPFLNHSIEKEEILSNMLSADKDIIISKSDDENTKATIKNLNETNTKQLEKIDEPFSTQSIEDEEILSNVLSGASALQINQGAATGDMNVMNMEMINMHTKPKGRGWIAKTWRRVKRAGTFLCCFRQ